MEIGKPEREVETAPPFSVPWSSPTESEPLHIGEPVREIEIPERIEDPELVPA